MDLLAQMATFVRVVEGRSLSAAARTLRLSLPAVSRQLRALEEELGSTLVARTTRSLRLTEAGQRWYEHSVRILADVESAKTSVGRGRGLSGRLVVSAPISLGLAFVAPVVASLVAAHRGLEVDLRLEDRVVELVSDGVDVAVRGGIVPPDSTSIVAQPVLSFDRLLVASRAYVAQRGTPKDPRELARHCCLVQTGPEGPVDEWRFGSDRGEERSVRVRHRLHCNAPIALRDAARAGAGVALLGDWLVAEDLRARRLVRVLERWRQAPVTVWAVHRADARGSERVRVFVDALRRSDPRPRAGAAAEGPAAPRKFSGETRERRTRR